jgi:hypothetical protein
VAILQISLLLGLLYWGIWFRRESTATKICALFIFLWSTLVCSALVLSYFGLLGNLIAYEGASLFFAASFSLFIRRITYNSSVTEIAPHKNYSRIDKWVNRFSWFSILIVLVLTAIICTFYVANNFDSVAYRFPRAFFFIGQGTLHQVPGDPRIQFYPFDISLIYVWFAIHGLAGVWFNLFSFVSWLVGGVATWRFSRDLGAGRTSALLVAALFITTPAVLVSASSTNDDLITGIPLLIGVMFLVRWWKSASWYDVILAAMGIGLSAGSKLHIAMMAPIAILFILSVTYRLISIGQFRIFLRARIAQIFAASAIAGILALPVFWFNYTEAHALIFDVPGFQNSPFSIIAASVHSLISAAGMFLGPVPDLYLAHSQDARKIFGDSFNNWINSHFFSWVTPNLHYSHEPYFYFDGVVSNAAYLGVNEVSVWLGFVPWLLALALILSVRQKSGQLRDAALWLTLAFFSWHLTRCFQLKYVRGEGIYYAFSIGLVIPALAWLWEFGTTKGRLAGFLLRGACIAVLVTNLVSAANYFMFNYQRSLLNLRAHHFKPDSNYISPSLSQFLKTSKRTLIVYSQWELPFFTFMSESPSSFYETATTLNAAQKPDVDLAFVLARNGIEIPFSFEHDDRHRLELLGTALTLYGRQRVFGAGSILQQHEIEVLGQPKYNPDEHTYAILQLNQQRSKDGKLNSIQFSNAYGIDADESLMISATLVTKNAANSFLSAKTWPLKELIHVPSTPMDGLLLIQIWRKDRPGIHSHIWIPIDPNASWQGLETKNLMHFDANKIAEHDGLATNWLPERDGYSQMSSTQSTIRLPLLAGFRSCAANMETTARGAGHISIFLNGKLLRKSDLSGVNSSQLLQLVLPDQAIRSDNNQLEFRTSSQPASADYQSYFGLKSISINCSSYMGKNLFINPPTAMPSTP